MRFRRLLRRNFGSGLQAAVKFRPDRRYADVQVKSEIEKKKNLQKVLLLAVDQISCNRHFEAVYTKL